MKTIPKSLTLALTLLAAGPIASAGATSAVSHQEGASGQPGWLQIYGDERASDVSVSATADGYTVTDPGGVLSGSGCVALDATSARCIVDGWVVAQLAGGDDSFRIAGGTGKAVFAYGGGGDDRLAGPSLPGAGYMQMTGGEGDDRIAGADGDDRLKGGKGADVINGRGGRDVLIGNAGRDQLIGGDGPDRLRFDTDGTRDLRARCGAGFDTVFLDAKDPEPGANCELNSRGIAGGG